MKRTRNQFIDKHSSLFWDVPESARYSIGDARLVETTLNYGSLDDFRELMQVLTPQRVAKTFFSATGRQQGNYYPEIRHFFSLVLKKYA